VQRLNLSTVNFGAVQKLRPPSGWLVEAQPGPEGLAIEANLAPPPQRFSRTRSRDRDRRSQYFVLRVPGQRSSGDLWLSRNNPLKKIADPFAALRAQSPARGGKTHEAAGLHAAIGGVAVASPLQLHAQQTAKTYRVAYLGLAGNEDAVLVKQRLDELGYREGREFSF
jgi:hypothetical protein